MWCVRLGDKEDPLTNLYIYVDATNENVVGAGKASDWDILGTGLKNSKK